MNFLALEKALKNKKKNESKATTPEAFDALEYFALMEKEHDKLFGKAFDYGEDMLDVAFDMFDVIDMQTASIPLSFSEISHLI
jgi:hypothetical protein